MKLSGRLPKDVWKGIRRHPFAFLQHWGVGASVCWCATEILTYFLKVDASGIRSLVFVTLVSSLWAMRQVWKPSKISLRIPTTNTFIEVKFGNLFEEKGLRCVTVNEYFDSELGTPVAESSLHGLLIKREFGGFSSTFDSAVTPDLGKATEFWDEPGKSLGKSRRFEIGTTAKIDPSGGTYLLVAFTNTDPLTCKASADVQMMWKALHCLWTRARTECGGQDLNVPLIGSGLSGVGLASRDLLNLIVLSIITETKHRQVTRTIRILLAQDKYDEMDLREVELYWRH